MPAADHGPTAPFLARIGAELRARRRAAGLTAQELAERAAVSRRMLSQVEHGQANPSLVTVDKLARALGTDFAALAGAGDAEPVAAGRPTEVWRSAAGGSATLHVTGARVGGPELWEWTLAPGDTYRAEPDPPGSEELLLVLAGTLTLELRESQVVLVAGASARLASDRAYAYANHGDAPARFARVVQIAGARRPDRLRA
jgi:DNA-binding XRE family transcriptional regulator